MLFLAALAAAIWFTARASEWRPAAFGLLWFGMALLPAALLPQSEVEDDRRMFFPFVGLALAVTWTGYRVLVARHGVWEKRREQSGAS